MALRPHSRGYVHLNSADPTVQPRIDPNYLADPRDAATLLAGIRAVRRLVQMPSLKDLVVRETRPGPEVQTEQQITDYIRLTTATTWHVVGSCKMGSDEMAVVDSELRVRGIDGLRVIDSSVFPTVPSSNTNAPTIALGEKGADIVLTAWNGRTGITAAA
jgi:choline dehydrogenase